jgi:RHS repeat-associated protein
MTGTPTWNANWTLGTLAISDGLNSADTQSCTYGYDNLARLTSAGCGSVWSQSFTYDAFGNIKESGSQSFQPTYSATTNQMTNTGAVTPTYDTNGNLTYDGFYNYTWDGEGNLATLNGNAETYDALDRRVEQYNGSAYTEIVYGPAGNKMALMSGQTVTKVFAPLSAGATAVYNSSGLAYYRHPDWLGSSRVASTTSRTLYYDGAYAPFGESYAETGTTDRNLTGQNQDLTPASTGDLYDFLYREYHKIQGRWVSPDRAGISAVDPTNPQSWNRYAYVTDNPLALIDPYGLYLDCGGEICQPFSYDVGLGCMMNVTYSWVTGDDGVDYQMPNFDLECSVGQPVAGATGGVLGGAGNGQKQSRCATPNFLQRAGIPVQQELAQTLNAPVGVGAGGSAGAGYKVGVQFSLSRQVVVFPNGEAGFLTTWTVPNPYGLINGVTTGGAGAYGGAQFSVFQNANTLDDLAGPSASYGSGGGDLLGGGIDFSFGTTSGNAQMTITLGLGIGGYSQGGQVTSSAVMPFCR